MQVVAQLGNLAADLDKLSWRATRLTVLSVTGAA